MFFTCLCGCIFAWLGAEGASHFENTANKLPSIWSHNKILAAYKKKC